MVTTVNNLILNNVHIAPCIIKDNTKLPHLKKYMTNLQMFIELSTFSLSENRITQDKTICNLLCVKLCNR